MKRKFFLLLFLVLIIVSLVTGIIFVKYDSNERIRLVDEKIEWMMSALITTGISSTEIEQVDMLLSKALGPESPLAIVSLYDDMQSTILYRNPNGFVFFRDQILKTNKAKDQIDLDDHSFRVLTIRLPQSQKVLQVGLMLDRGYLHWSSLSTSWFFLFLPIVVMVTLISWLLTRWLLGPLESTSDYLKDWIDRMAKIRRAEIPERLIELAHSLPSGDPFRKLVRTSKENFSKSFSWEA